MSDILKTITDPTDDSKIIVAVEGIVHDWAAYRGEGSSQYVADRGDKLLKKEALKLFPVFNPSKYRS